MSALTGQTAVPESPPVQAERMTAPSPTQVDAGGAPAEAGGVQPDAEPADEPPPAVDQSPEADTDREWVTVVSRGMSIDLPAVMLVETDAQAAAQLLSALGDPGWDYVIEYVSQYPEWFVLLAVQDPQAPEAGVPDIVIIGEFPRGGRTVHEIASVEEVESSGAKVYYAGDESIGAGQYPTYVRLYAYSGGPAIVSYAIPRGPMLWTVDFTVVQDMEAQFGVVQESISTLTLPEDS